MGQSGPNGVVGVQVCVAEWIDLHGLVIIKVVSKLRNAPEGIDLDNDVAAGVIGGEGGFPSRS